MSRTSIFDMSSDDLAALKLIQDGVIELYRLGWDITTIRAYVHSICLKIEGKGY